MAGGLTICDDNYKIVFCNEMAINLSGLTAEHWKPGTHIRDILKIGVSLGVYNEFNTVDELLIKYATDLDRAGLARSLRHQPDGRIISETF